MKFFEPDKEEDLYFQVGVRMPFINNFDASCQGKVRKKLAQRRTKGCFAALARLFAVRAIEGQALQSDSRLSLRLIRLWRKQACGLERPANRS